MNKVVTFISEQSYEPINRSIYVELLSIGIISRVWVPHDSLKVINEKKVYSVNGISVSKYHPRKYFIPMSKELKFDLKKSSSIVIEGDIASLVIMQLVLYKLIHLKNTNIFVSTFENIEKNYSKIALQFLLKFDIVKFIIFITLHILTKINSRFIDGLFVYSEESRVIHERRFKNLQIYKLPLGINENLFNKGNVRRSINTIAYLGRVVEFKRPHLVLDIYLNVSKKNKNLKLIMQSPKKYENEYSFNLYNKILELSDCNITLVDPTHEEMPGVLQLVDLVIVPSAQNNYFKEQYGRIVVEAKLSGCIVLVSNSGALPEVLMNDKLVVRSDDLEEWEKSVKSLLALNEDMLETISLQLRNSSSKNQTIKVQAYCLSKVV